MESTCNDPGLNVWIDKFLYTGAAFAPTAFLYSILIIINKAKKRNKIILLSCLCSLVFLFFNLFFRSIYIPAVTHRISFRYIASPGPVWYLFILFFTCATFYGLFELHIERNKSIGRRKTQLTYLFIAYLIVIIAALFYLLLVFNIETPPVDNFLVIVYSFMMAYAILKHHLLDIEIVIKRGLVYSVLTGFNTGIFVSLIFVGNYFFSGITGYNSLWSSVIGAFVIAMIFQPLRDIIQNIVDRTFFRARYNYQQILNKYSHTLAQPMADLSRFARIAPYLLTKSMKLSGSSVMVLDRATHNYVVRAGEREGRALEGTVVPETSALVKELMKQEKGFSLEEIMDLEKNASEKDKKHYQEVLEAMKALKSVLIIPSISEGQYFHKATLLSTINLSRKLSEESFSREDVEFLRTLANQAAISIEYAFILEELQRNQKQIIQSEKLATIGITTAGVAHELKNPLTYLHTLGQILPMKWQDKEFMESVIKLLPTETQRMQLIVEGLLDYSRSRELMLKPLDVSTVTDKGLALLAYEIRKQRVEVETNYEHKKNTLGDPNRLMQVFMNVIANAVQAMGEAGGDLTITTKDEGTCVVVMVTDTGPGMSKEQQTRIFDSFFTTKEEGTGLGLPISKKIVEEHHGSMEVESKEGKGTTFTISLPAAA
ncbi:hypothetical protein A2462_06285 [candidate division WOR-1 bacterium RIFOXYC2_FULL_41_25]|uniref:histidine kinase n=1 Tax=candidate division WOR-1 bacterium RIFOXYC2_FULL_41_25 TaxID=1802586 RepID=A0A1F4TKU0_UNCSA|nr:MAG: hypothetical protein A2462_06285 [candidate division WOR-1 bacterium RIFOXYC2_FULL_41_25]